MAKAAAKRGRKAKSAQERKRIIDHVLAELSTGRPIRRTLEEDEGMCAPSCFWRWVFNDETGELESKVARARECGIEAKMDEALDVAGRPMLGEVVTYERDPDLQKDIEDGQEPTNLVTGDPYEGMICKVRREDMLGHRKLLIDTIHKQAQMLKPKTYGPKLDLTSGGERLGLAAEIEAARKRAADGSTK